MAKLGKYSTGMNTKVKMTDFGGNKGYMAKEEMPLTKVSEGMQMRDGGTAQGKPVPITTNKTHGPTK